MIQDLRHALRVLFKQPSLHILAILAIAIGIAANAAIFSVAEGVLLRPLPYNDSDRLVFIRSDFRDEAGAPGVAAAEIEDIRKQSRLIEAIGFRVHSLTDLTDEWGPILMRRLAMYQKLREEARQAGTPMGHDAFHKSYIRFVALVHERILGGVRIVAEK